MENKHSNLYTFWGKYVSTIVELKEANHTGETQVVIRNLENSKRNMRTFIRIKVTVPITEATGLEGHSCSFTHLLRNKKIGTTVVSMRETREKKDEAQEEGDG